MAVKSLFPTLLASAQIGDEPLRTELEQACWQLEADDAAGNQWCDEQGYDGYTSYASLDDLPQRFPAFARLAELLDAEAKTFAQALSWDFDPARLKLDALWVNILGRSC